MAIAISDRSVMYETGSVCSQARSLWRVQHVRVKWYGGFMGYGRAVRIRHVTSGRYLGVTSDHKLVTYYRLDANNDQTIFLLRDSKVSEQCMQSVSQNHNGYSWDVLWRAILMMTV